MYFQTNENHYYFYMYATGKHCEYITLAPIALRPYFSIDLPIIENMLKPTHLHVLNIFFILVNFFNIQPLF